MAPTGGDSALEDVLSSSEVDDLHTDIRRKLTTWISDYKNKLQDVEANFERYKINSEQRYFELEKEMVLHKNQLVSQTNLLLDANKRHSETERNRDDMSLKLSSIQGQLATLQADKGHLETANQQLKTEKDELVALLDRKAKDIQALNDEWKSMSDRLTQVASEKCEAVSKLEDLHSKEISLQYRETRFEQEKVYLQQQIDWLNGELSQKSTELFGLKKSQTVSTMELHNQLEQKTEEVNHLQETLDAQRKNNEQQLAQINSYIQKLKDVQSSGLQVEEHYRRELQAQQRLVELYKSSSEESEEKVKELMTAVEELQKLLSQVSEECRTTLQAKEDDIARLEEGLNMRDEQIRKMDLELKNSNELLRRTSGQVRPEDVEAMSPAAAAASKLLRSGMTLTQIYSEYVQAADTLALEKEENKRLHLYLDQILQEIEEKAPALKRQREEYERALVRINSLTSQLEEAMLECERERIAADEANRKAGVLAREDARLKLENKDLSLQVQILLKEVEQSCGNFVSSSGPESPGDRATADEVSSSAYLITDRLVTFRNVEELQAQNQKLLQVVRELSEDREAAERASVDARTADLQKQLVAAQHDVEELRSARVRQVELVESIVRQRDMYRVMLTQAGVSPMPPVPAASPQKSHSSVQTAMSPAAVQPARAAQPTRDSSSGGDDASAHAAELKAAMKELQEEFVTYKQERQRNEKLLSDQAETLKKDLSDLRMQNAKLAAQLEFSTERFKALQANADGYKRELELLRTRNAKHGSAIVQHEQTIASLREETMAVQERLARSDARCQALSQERDMLKAAESRLLIEMDSMRRERSTNNVVLTNLMAIQNNLERTEFELKTKYGSRSEAVERENVSLKKKLDSAADHQTAVAKALEDQLAVARGRLEHESGAHQKTREELMRAYADVSNLKHELTVLTARTVGVQQAAVPLQTSPGRKHGQADAPAEGTQLELQQATAQIEALQEQLDKSRQHAEQYKAIAESIEQSLRDQNEASRQFKEALEKKLAEAVNASAEWQRNVQVLEKERQDLLSENIRIAEESHQLNADLRKQLASLQNELESCAHRLDSAVSSERLARDDLVAQTRLAQEAQDKYERELLLHAGNVERLNSLKHELANFNARMATAQDAAIAAEVALQSSQTSWQEREKLLVEENARLSTAVHDLNKQRELLHDQLENLSSQMAALGRRDASSLDTSFGEDSTKTKSTEQLLEVIRFLRREKEIVETKLEMSQAEASRSRQRLQLLEHQMEGLSQALSTEREKNEAIAQTAAQHAELLRKVEQLNLLSDSNRLLREEKERLAVQVQESELKSHKLEGTLEPLRQQLAQLEAQSEALDTDKKLLQSEVERWKARTNQLIEQSHKADPEELKKATGERDELKKKVSSYVEENQKSRAEISRLNALLNQSRQEGAQVKQQTDKALAERDELKKKVGSYVEENQKHRAEISRLNSQLTSLRTELTASKQQIDKLSAQLSTAKAESAALAAASAAASAAQLPQAASGSLASTNKDSLSVLDSSPATSAAAAALGGQPGNARQSSEAAGEVQQLQKKLLELARQMEEKEKIVANLRKIGRKYKQQYEDLQKEYAALKPADGSAPAAAAGEAAALAGPAAAASQSPPTESAEGAGAASAAAATTRELTAKVEQLEEERAAHLKRIAELEAKVNAMTSELSRLTQENSVLKATEDRLKKENSSLDEKLRQKLGTLQTAKEKLQSQRQEITLLQQQNQQASDRLQLQSQQMVDRLQQQQLANDAAQAEMREQHEADVRRLEAELQEARRVAQELLEDAQQQQLQQQQLPPPPHPTSMPATSTVSVSTTSAGDHPTANIRPLTSPAAAAATSLPHSVPGLPAPLRQGTAAAVQHVVGAAAPASAAVAVSSAAASSTATPSSSISASAAAAASSAMGGGRMTASIRPMSQSRTATVMPTTVSAAAAAPTAAATPGPPNGQSQPEAASSSSSAGGTGQQPPLLSPAADSEPLMINIQQSAVRRLQPVQPVSPRLDDGGAAAAAAAATSSLLASAIAQGLVGAPPATAAATTSSLAQHQQQHLPEPDTSSRQAAATVAAADDRASSAAAAEAGPAPASTSTPAGSKRSRTDEESPESSTPEVKKARAETVALLVAEGTAAAPAAGTAAAAMATGAASEARTEEEEDEIALGQEPESLNADMTSAADVYGGDEAAAAAYVPGEVQPAADETDRDADVADENEAAAMPAAEDAGLPLAAANATPFGRAADSALPAPSDEPSSELQEVFIEGSDDGATGGVGGSSGSGAGGALEQGMPNAEDIVVVEEDVESLQYYYGEPDDDEGNYEESEQQVGTGTREEDGGSQYEGEGSEQGRYDDEEDSEDREYEGEGEEEEEEANAGVAEASGDESRASSSGSNDRVEGGAGSHLERANEGDANVDDDDDDVVIVDDDAPTAAAVSSAQPAVSSMAHLVPSVSHQAPQSSRRQLTSAVTRLHSFHGGNAFMSQTSMFGETNEDGVVPSTPTLFVPKRADGFAEAVSSPYRVTDSFLFAAGADAQPEFGQLASQVYMDDIRDLSQFDGNERPQTTSAVGSTAMLQQSRASTSQQQTTSRAAAAPESSASAGPTNEQLAQSSVGGEPSASASRAAGEQGDQDSAAASSGLSAEAAESGRSDAETYDDASANYPSSSLPAGPAGGRILRRGRGGQSTSRGAPRSSRLNRPQFRSDQP